MPEGHVLHRIANELNESFGGKELEVTSPQGRFAAEAARLDGHVMTRAEALGKQLFIFFDVPEPVGIHIHLGLIGRFVLGPGTPSTGQIRLRLSNGSYAAHLHGPQWCRAITMEQYRQAVATSGPDPIRDDADPDVGYQRLHRSGKSLAALLMDQRIAAGVGNIFRAEVLFRLQLRPMTPGKQIDKATWQAIWDDLVFLMRRGVEEGRIDTVRKEHSPQAQGRDPRNDPHGGEVYVYRRAGDPCLVCGTPVSTKKLEGRHLYWCSHCQRRIRAR